VNPAEAAQRVLSFRDARRVVEEHAAKPRSGTVELVDLLHAHGRLLAENLTADRDFPPFPRAMRDGFALIAADVAAPPSRLRVVGEVKAGAGEIDFQIRRGEAAEIMTGAPVPQAADAVVMVEYTARDGDKVEVQRSVKSGDNVVPRGAEAREGAILLSAWTHLSPAAIAIAASVGKAMLHVFAKPRVAILATGDELVDVAADPGPHQIRNSNTYSLAAQVEAAGAQPVILPIAPDEKQQLHNLVQAGLSADLLLLSGGVSMGKYDLVEQVLEELGADFFFTGAQIQPGRPVVFGRAPARGGALPTYFFGLPGNPVSTMVTFELFARTMVEALAGLRPRPPIFLSARLKREVKTKTGLTRFLPALLSGEYERAEIELLPWQGSGDVAATARANCFLVIPPDREKIDGGEWVSVLKVSN